MADKPPTKHYLYLKIASILIAALCVTIGVNVLRGMGIDKAFWDGVRQVGIFGALLWVVFLYLALTGRLNHTIRSELTTLNLTNKSREK